MRGCLAPSEIPGVTSSDASVFGSVAEEIIYADFVSQYAPTGPNQLFRDANNPAGYLYFLAVNNPQFTQEIQEDYYRRLRTEGLGRVPDFMVHKPNERSFYEVKPDSPTGMTAGIEKVGILRAVYTFYQLPYTAGATFSPRNHRVANFGTALQVTLNVRRAAEGLIVYKLCLESEGVLELATIAALLKVVVDEMNRQRGRGDFRPIDLEPVFQHQQLYELATALGLSLAAVTAAVAVRAGWRHFWTAVIRRFAVRGAAAATLTAVDGPLPVGDLIAAGLAIWTIIDIVRLSGELWQDAELIAQTEA